MSSKEQLTSTGKPNETHPNDANKLDSLFHTMQESFPTEALGKDRWYLLVLAALAGGSHGHLAGDLYTYLTSKPKYTTPEQRQALVRRLRECLFKCVPLMGVVKTLEAVFSIAKVEKVEDRDLGFSRESWTNNPQNSARGQAWLHRLYASNISGPSTAMSAHKDFWWMSNEITYGLFLSDHSILNDVETELVTLCGIMIQNAPMETGWHLRGLRRVGVKGEDVEMVQGCMEAMALFMGMKLDKVPRVKDIEHEV